MVARRTKNRELESYALGTRGLIEYSRGRERQAIVWHKRSLQIAIERTDLPDIAHCCNHIANAMDNLGMLNAAMDKYKFAMVIWRHLRDPDEFASVLGNMASLELGRGRLKSALRYQRRALGLHRRYGEPTSMSISLSVLSDIHRARGNLRLATRYANESLAIDRRLGNPRRIAGRLLDLAHIAEDRKDPRQAKRLVLRAAGWYEKAGLSSDAKDARKYAATLSPPPPPPARSTPPSKPRAKGQS